MKFTRSQINLAKKRQELVSDAAAYSFLVMRSLNAKKLCARRQSKRAAKAAREFRAQWLYNL